MDGNIITHGDLERASCVSVARTRATAESAIECALPRAASAADRGGDAGHVYIGVDVEGVRGRVAVDDGEGVWAEGITRSSPVCGSGSAGLG